MSLPDASFSYEETLIKPYFQGVNLRLASDRELNMLSLYFLNCSANLPFTNPSNDLYTNAIPTEQPWHAEQLPLAAQSIALGHAVVIVWAVSAATWSFDA